ADRVCLISPEHVLTPPDYKFSTPHGQIPSVWPCELRVGSSGSKPSGYTLALGRCSGQSREWCRGEHDFHGNFKVLRNLQRQVQAGTIFTALQIANGLVMDIQSFRELPA